MKHARKMFSALFTAGGTQFILGFAVVVFTGQALAQGDTWDTTKASRVTATTGSSAGVIDGILYVVGGNGGGSIDVLEAYDPVSDTWTTKSPIPTARSFAASGVINGKLYVVGGGNPMPISQVDIYDPVTNSWSTASNPMLDPRSNVAAGVIDGILYVVGGDVFGVNASVNSLREYNPVTDSWVLKASMPTARQVLAVGVIDEKLYAVGGLQPCCTSLATLEVYDPGSNSWTTAAPLPVGKNQLVAGVIYGKLYAVTGIPTTGGATNHTFGYDPTTNTWASRTPIPTERFAASAGVIDGKLYVVGGSDGLSALTALEVYTPPQSVAANTICPQLPFESCPTSVDIQIDMSQTSELLGSFTATLTWDPTIIDYTGNSGLPAGFTEVINIVDIATGLLTFNGANANGASGLINALTVNFDVIGNEDDVNTFDLEISAMAGANTFNDLLPSLTTNDCSSTIDDGGVLGDVNNDGLVNFPRMR